jgi:hypothetical protein
MNRARITSLLGLVSALSLGTHLAACETEAPTKAVVENAYPAPVDGADPAHQTVVYRAWWVTTYFPEAVPAGASSTEQRSVPAADFAYALLAKGWDPSSTTPPTAFVVVKSKAPLSVARGEVLPIVVSDATFSGNCAANAPLSQEDADFITQRLFPREFSGFTYNAKTCTMTAEVEAGATEAGTGDLDGGVDGRTDG